MPLLKSCIHSVPPNRSIRKPSIKSISKSKSTFPLLESIKWTHLRELQQLHAQMIITGFIHHVPSIAKLISHALSADSTGLAYACRVFTHTYQPNILTNLEHDVKRLSHAQHAQRGTFRLS
jgi:hypothetical protein